jgi:hypothetical protein
MNACIHTYKNAHIHAYTRVKPSKHSIESRKEKNHHERNSAHGSVPFIHIDIIHQKTERNTKIRAIRHTHRMYGSAPLEINHRHRSAFPDCSAKCKAVFPDSSSTPERVKPSAKAAYASSRLPSAQASRSWLVVVPFVCSCLFGACDTWSVT